jgi:hypothetical protein
MPTTLGLVDRAGPFPGPANGFRNRSSNDDAQVNVLADEDLSTGTSLAEEEVEAVLSSSPSLKRKLSVSESVSPPYPLSSRILIPSHVESDQGFEYE